MTTSSTAASFRNKLAPLAHFLDDPAVTEIAINKPGEVWIGSQGKRYMEAHALPEMKYALLASLAELTANYTKQDSDEKKKPLLSATIPIDLREGIPDSERGGYRIQVVKPPAVAEGTVAICIRKPTLLELKLSDYTKQGAFNDVNNRMKSEVAQDDQLAEFYREKRWPEFLSAAVKSHKNIVISAGTNTGKTTALNALLQEIPPEERIVTIEDSREVRPYQRNCLHLLYSRGAKGETDVTPIDLLEAMLRLTPDRPIAGELRGAEAYSFLELINSGHSGSITTIHSDSPTLMFKRLAQMVMRFGAHMSQDQIEEYARSLINVVVQLKRGSDGQRYISEIYYDRCP